VNGRARDARDGNRRPADADVEAVLFPSLHAMLGARPLHGQTRRAPFDYSTSSTIELLTVMFPGGRSLELLFKDLSPGSLLPQATGVRPQFLHRPELEALVYERLLAGRDLGTAVCYGWSVDEQAGRYWLFLEKVVGHPLCHVGEFGRWCAAAGWLARLHTLPATAPAPPLNAIPLLRYDRAFFEEWRRRAEQSLAGRPIAAAARRQQLERLTDAYGRAIPELASLDGTLVHGEYYASNVIVPDAPGDRTACPIDWGTAGLGAAGLDLAALTSGRWTPEQRRAMVSAYRQALKAAAGRARPLDELLREVDLCTLHHAVQWVFWSERWEAPADQRHDWLDAGLAVAKRLGV
jgi:hypothetical protein